LCVTLSGAIWAMVSPSRRSRSTAAASPSHPPGRVGSQRGQGCARCCRRRARRALEPSRACLAGWRPNTDPGGRRPQVCPQGNDEVGAAAAGCHSSSLVRIPYGP
jgi:hypothetical protein